MKKRLTARYTIVSQNTVDAGHGIDTTAFKQGGRRSKRARSKRRR
jgi:hypothetical protein